MKVIKITLADKIELFVSFDELSKFDPSIADIRELRGIEMSEEDYKAIPLSNQSNLFFKP